MQKLPQALLKSFFQALLKIVTREGLLLSKPLFYPLWASSGGQTFVTNFVGNLGMQAKLANLATFDSLG